MIVCLAFSLLISLDFKTSSVDVPIIRYGSIIQIYKIQLKSASFGIQMDCEKEF